MFARRPIAFVVLIVHLSGCYSWRALPTQEPLPRKEDRVRVSRTSGPPVVLYEAQVMNDSLVGAPDVPGARQRLAIAWSDVIAIRAYRLNVGQTSGLLLGIGAGVLLVGAAMAWSESVSNWNWNWSQ